MGCQMCDQESLEITGSLAVRRPLQQYNEMWYPCVGRGPFAIMIESHVGIVCNADLVLILGSLAPEDPMESIDYPSNPTTLTWDSIIGDSLHHIDDPPIVEPSRFGHRGFIDAPIAVRDQAV